MKLFELFRIRYGNREFTNKESLDTGLIPIISSQAVDNGVYGFFDVEKNFLVTPSFITVQRTGSIGFAFVQLKPVATSDDVLVLTPRQKYDVEYLFYVASIIRKSRWRYNYGRKITPKRIAELELQPPEKTKVNISYKLLLRKNYPQKRHVEYIGNEPFDYKELNITQFFNVQRGHFHAIDQLDEGRIPTISRVSFDNGLVGFYQKPKRAKIFKEFLLTISTVTGDTFLQTIPFIATDNVLILSPKLKCHRR